MQTTLEKNLQILKSAPKTWLNNILVGVEKELLRTDNKGNLSQTPHPHKLGSALTHSHITTDYSESLLELITPPMRQKSQIVNFLLDLHAWCAKNIDESELLWANSMPCKLPQNNLIPIAQYGTSNQGKMRHIYRKGLDLRYGRSMQCIAGLHYNFSLPQSFWDLWLENILQIDKDSPERQDIITQGYFNLIRNFRRYSWILLYLFGATPNMDKSFAENINAQNKLQNMQNSSFGLPYATSLRMSSLGYQNPVQSKLSVCFNSLQDYTKSLMRATSTPEEQYLAKGVIKNGEYLQLNANILQIENEFYSDIRPKRTSRFAEQPSKALLREGVEYVEVRNMDINPFILGGIDEQVMQFLDVFLLFCILDTTPNIKGEECDLIQDNKRQITFAGRDKNLDLSYLDGDKKVYESGLAVLDKLHQVAEFLDSALPEENNLYKNILANQSEKFKHSELTPSAKWLEFCENKGFLNAALQIAEQQTAEFKHRKIQPANLDLFEQLTYTSLAMQSAYEKDTSISFEDYLQQYFI